MVPAAKARFGSKAGDTFTVITVVMAAFWGFTCAFTMWLLGTHAPTAITDSAISAGPGDDATNRQRIGRSTNGRRRIVIDQQR